jgi:hypothetical protein
MLIYHLGMNKRPVGGNSETQSHPIDMNNKKAYKEMSVTSFDMTGRYSLVSMVSVCFLFSFMKPELEYS